MGGDADWGGFRWRGEELKMKEMRLGYDDDGDGIEWHISYGLWRGLGDMN